MPKSQKDIRFFRHLIFNILPLVYGRYCCDYLMPYIGAAWDNLVVMLQAAYMHRYQNPGPAIVIRSDGYSGYNFLSSSIDEHQLPD